MAEPAFIAGADTPHQSDTRWFRWQRICGAAWNTWGGDADLKPKPTDTVRRLMDKTERILDAIP